MGGWDKLCRSMLELASVSVPLSDCTICCICRNTLHDQKIPSINSLAVPVSQEHPIFLILSLVIISPIFPSWIQLIKTFNVVC